MLALVAFIKPPAFYYYRKPLQKVKLVNLSPSKKSNSVIKYPIIGDAVTTISICLAGSIYTDNNCHYTTSLSCSPFIKDEQLHHNILSFHFSLYPRGYHAFNYSLKNNTYACITSVAT